MCRPPILARKSPPKAPVPSPLPVASPDEKRAALKSNGLLKQSLIDLQHQLQGGLRNIEGLEVLISKSNQHLDDLNTYLSTTIEPTYYNEIVPAGSTATQRTFAVPELFEMIMEHLTIPSILAFSQSCHEYKARIDNSQHLQQILRLRAVSPTSHLRHPWSNDLPKLPDGPFLCKPTSMLQHSVHVNNNGESTLKIAAALPLQGDEQHLPRIGSTYRRMFVTQPPVKELVPEIRCCKRRDQTPIVREEGIRIGDLYDVAKEMVEEHRWCPNEDRLYNLFNNGQTQVDLKFKGTISLHPTDPLLRRYATDAAVDEVDRKQRKWIRRRNSQYRLAKDRAHAQELPNPTLPEWLEAHPEWKTQDGEEEEVATVADTAAIEPTTVPIDAFSFN